ncbi:hypothetical protein PR048_012269 [Dryococelus australis]|uniref:Uncharacterized protein n=1 Tax=Dryococelus australis TaxID=614101 RepID=A0ABQ9HNW6_9NEOP|nr:hypothetical protein PR048_012269 [Dryococelus australis]
MLGQSDWSHGSWAESSLNNIFGVGCHRIYCVDDMACLLDELLPNDVPSSEGLDHGFTREIGFLLPDLEESALVTEEDLTTAVYCMETKKTHYLMGSFQNFEVIIFTAEAALSICK